MTKSRDVDCENCEHKPVCGIYADFTKLVFSGSWTGFHTVDQKAAIMWAVADNCSRFKLREEEGI